MRKSREYYRCTCVICRKEYTSSSLLTHFMRTHENTGRFDNSGNHGVIWNRGLTKETDARLKIFSQEHHNKGKRFGASLNGHSLEARKRLSEIRKEYLSLHPDKVPYKINHSSKVSYPEKYFAECFEGTNVISEFPISRYSLDFANPEKKIYFEVDGEQHFLDAKIVKSDKQRAIYLLEEGWTMFRCRWSEFQKLTPNQKKEYVEKIIKNLGL